MLVTLIGKDNLYKIRLPNKKTGDYWITDNESGKKLINIIGKNNEWQLYSNEQAKILNPRVVSSINISKIVKSSSNILSYINLKENGIYYVSLAENPNTLYILLCESVYEKNFVHLKTNNFQEITVGSSENNDIIYNNPIIREKQARIFFSNGKLMLENYDESYGTFLNNLPVANKLKLVFNGDIIYIMGLRIVLVGNNIFINNPFNRVTYSLRKFELAEERQVQITNYDIQDENIQLFSDKDYFTRAPRITNKIEKEKINKKMKDEMKKAQKDAKKEMSEFKKFISKGNVVDMAVGVIIGGAFGKIVTSLVNDIITPAIGIIIGGLNFSNLSIQIGEAKIMYGNFIQTVIDFLIIAICIFSVIRIFERVKNRNKKEEPAPEAPKKSAEVLLLEEIRDLMKNNVNEIEGQEKMEEPIAKG